MGHIPSWGAGERKSEEHLSMPSRVSVKLLFAYSPKSLPISQDTHIGLMEDVNAIPFVDWASLFFLVIHFYSFLCAKHSKYFTCP